MNNSNVVIPNLTISVKKERGVVIIKHPELVEGIYANEIHEALINNGINHIPNSNITVHIDPKSYYQDVNTIKSIPKIERILEEFLSDDNRYIELYRQYTDYGLDVRFAKDINGKDIKLDNLYKSMISLVTIIDNERYLLYMKDGEIYLSSKKPRKRIPICKLYDIKDDEVINNFEDLYNIIKSI